jgi:hypothetical protein
MAFSLSTILRETKKKDANAKGIAAKAYNISATAKVYTMGANTMAKTIDAKTMAKTIDAKTIDAKTIDAKTIEDAKTKDAKAKDAKAKDAKDAKANLNEKAKANIPRKIFIIPYRNRENQKQEFLKHMNGVILVDEPEDSYEIYFAHQYDARPFNRGAMKNIGFLAMKRKYPLHYKQITFIFHDVDTLPSVKGMIGYETVLGVVKHYYGYEFALGGIFAIKGADFERSLGFPNFWGWGLEDNVIQDRSLAIGLTIDRSEFYHIRDPRIIRSFDGFERVISKRDSVVYKRETPDNLTSLTNVNWFMENEYINITHFTSSMDPNQQDYATHDIRNGNKLKVPNGYDRRSWRFDTFKKSVANPTF